MKNTMIRTLVFPIVTLAMLLTTSGAYTATRTEGAGDVPYYARIESGVILHTNEWAAIIFYRPSDCVPPDFNLLDFYDSPRAYSCTPPTTNGFIIWSGEPELSAPIQIKLDGLGAVPVWFVAWPQMQTAVADGQLNMSELENLSSLLVGSATFYTETLHPGGGKKPPMINCVAEGILEDGRSFYVSAVLIGDKVSNVSIAFVQE